MGWSMDEAECGWGGVWMGRSVDGIMRVCFKDNIESLSMSSKSSTVMHASILIRSSIDYTPKIEPGDDEDGSQHKAGAFCPGSIALFCIYGSGSDLPPQGGGTIAMHRLAFHLNATVNLAHAITHQHRHKPNRVHWGFDCSHPQPLAL